MQKLQNCKKISSLSRGSEWTKRRKFLGIFHSNLHFHFFLISRDHIHLQHLHLSVAGRSVFSFFSLSSVPVPPSRSHLQTGGLIYRRIAVVCCIIVTPHSQTHPPQRAVVSENSSTNDAAARRLLRWSPLYWTS